ncbi:uncharacterized protein [Triticum aestivum]|uniref:uncharacterized protein n=1 Tax=Triticum aestivum TaxID=4565 RepID=UPI001D02FD68|nr:uncharacterized protein LOC123164874 [Triticum aestivum]
MIEIIARCTTATPSRSCSARSQICRNRSSSVLVASTTSSEQPQFFIMVLRRQESSVPQNLKSFHERALNEILALHYVRQWMGTKLQRTLSPLGDEIDQSRMILLYEVLGLAGNIGQLPTKFKICQTDC